jgi:hypothetical protein
VTEILGLQPAKRGPLVVAAVVVVAVVAALVVRHGGGGTPEVQPSPTASPTASRRPVEYVTVTSGYATSNDDLRVSLALELRSVWPRQIRVIDVVALDAGDRPVTLGEQWLVAAPTSTALDAVAPGPVDLAAYGDVASIVLRTQTGCPPTEPVVALRLRLRVDDAPAEQVLRPVAEVRAVLSRLSTSHCTPGG